MYKTIQQNWPQGDNLVPLPSTDIMNSSPGCFCWNLSYHCAWKLDVITTTTYHYHFLKGFHVGPASLNSYLPIHSPSLESDGQIWVCTGCQGDWRIEYLAPTKSEKIDNKLPQLEKGVQSCWEPSKLTNTCFSRNLCEGNCKQGMGWKGTRWQVNPGGLKWTNREPEGHQGLRLEVKLDRLMTHSGDQGGCWITLKQLFRDAWKYARSN